MVTNLVNSVYLSVTLTSPYVYPCFLAFRRFRQWVLGEYSCAPPDASAPPQYPTWLFPAHLSPSAKGLLVRLLHPDPDQRLSAAEALKQPWLHPHPAQAQPMGNEAASEAVSEHQLPAMPPPPLGPGTPILSPFTARKAPLRPPPSASPSLPSRCQDHQPLPVPPPDLSALSLCGNTWRGGAEGEGEQLVYVEEEEEDEGEVECDIGGADGGDGVCADAWGAEVMGGDFVSDMRGEPSEYEGRREGRGGVEQASW